MGNEAFSTMFLLLRHPLRFIIANLETLFDIYICIIVFIFSFCFCSHGGIYSDQPSIGY